MAARKRPPRYEVRCRPEYRESYGLYDRLDDHLIITGSKATLERICESWNEKDPYRGQPSPARHAPPGGEEKREEWPPL